MSARRKQQEEWRPSSPKPFSAGDRCVSSYMPLGFTISHPCTVLACEADKHFVSGWKVVIETSVGNKELDSSHFRKVS